MPQTSSANDVLGIGTLLLVILCCLVGTFCLAYVLYFHVRVGKERQPLLRDFDSPWIVRIVLVCLSMLWSLGELFRLSWLREKDRLLYNMSLTAQANLCRFHVIWSVGLMEPGLLLTVLFLVRGSLLREAPRHLNARVPVLVFLSCLPLFILQLVFAVTGHSHPLKAFGEKLPSYFTRSIQVMEDDDGNQLAFCTYPLFSVLAFALFSIVFMFYFFRLGYKMLGHVINRKLRRRVSWLLVAVLVFLPLHVLLLGLTVRLSPNRVTHSTLMFLSFFTVLLCIAGAMGVLVVLPVADAIAVHFLFRGGRQQGLQCFSVSPVESFGRGSEEEDPTLHGVGTSVQEIFSSFEAEVHTSLSREGSLTFAALPIKDLTLGPGGWLVEMPGAVVTSPPSPVLPGRPLTLL